MKLPVSFAILALISAGFAANVPENAAEEIGNFAPGNLRVMALRGAPDENSDGGLTVWVESGKARADLPPSPLAIEGNAGGNSWSLPIPPDLAFAPDGQWLFATQKVCTGYRIGYLYKQKKGPNFELATKVRFDALAWRFFGKTEGVNIEALIASDSPAHLIDFVAFSDRYLAVSLRGAVGNLPASKNVASNPKNPAGATGIYDWQCIYDLQEGSFLLPETMRAYNNGAWRRWSDTGGTTWSQNIEGELNWVLRALLAKLDPDARKKLRDEQDAWLKRRDAESQDMDYDPFAFTRRRAVELQMRLLLVPG
ncbi:MAG: lysozyme inhibitor LprI family protein [Chthoniobacterales bacterium]